jgi:hypothetical protein
VIQQPSARQRKRARAIHGALWTGHGVIRPAFQFPQYTTQIPRIDLAIVVQKNEILARCLQSAGIPGARRTPTPALHQTHFALAAGGAQNVCIKIAGIIHHDDLHVSFQVLPPKL